MRITPVIAGLLLPMGMTAGMTAGLMAAPSALAEGFSLGAGFNYSSGDYGTGTTTEITSVPVIGQYETGPWKLKLTVPYIRVEGASSVIPGAGSVTNLNPAGRGRGNAVAAGTTTTTGTAQGLGDIVAAATYNAYYNSASKFGMDLTGKVKLGTADRDKGLGTGEHDYSIGVDLFKSLDRYTLFGGVGYTTYGSSSFISLDDAFSVNLGALYRLSDRSSAGLALDARERVSASSGPQRELTAFMTHELSKSWKAQGYVLKGFADGSPDWGVGAHATMAF